MRRAILLGAAAALLAIAGRAQAAATATVDVSATVVGTCQFASQSAAIAFGALPFDGNGNATGATASGSIQFRCTNGASWSIIDDDGQNATGPDQNRMKSTTLATAEYIPYTLSYTPATGTGAGWSNPQTLTLTATVAPGAYTSNSPDNYSDSVTLTINP